MPPRKKTETMQSEKIKGVIIGAGETVLQPITEILVNNYMPYTMSVIVSRAIPEMDGFKPSHRKLLYTMYKMGLLQGGRTKSANIVGQTMRLNPHGDGAIYETMVRLSKNNETLLHPYVDSKGNWGRAYSRDMAYAASRYTEAKLEPICAEMFHDIDKNTVDFVDNYDSTMKEPVLFPVTFPSVLVNANTGIAVGMASSICPFNLAEVCETTISYIKDKDHNLLSTLKAPDFIGGGQLIYNKEELEKIYTTGRGSIKIRSRYTYDKSNNCIDITQIPPTTTLEAIIDKVIELVKLNKVREVNDIRNETDLGGLKVTIDLKRGTDPDKLMQKLFKMTPLEDSFSCNFNILVKGMPRVMGVREILDEWIEFRSDCIRRRTEYQLLKAKERLHLLKGLQKILLDIDKAIKIVRETDEESEVVPNLMIGFGIDEIQAEYVAEIKLRHLNREYILKRLDDIEKLEQAIAQLEEILGSRSKIRNIIIEELKEVSKKYGKPRRTMLVFVDEEEFIEEEEEVPEYPVFLFYTTEGYFKKITPQSLRMSGEHMLKEGDSIVEQIESNNNRDLLFFSDKCQVYKAKANEFSDTKASARGDYIPSKLGFDDGENVIQMTVTKEYNGYLMFFFENGKVGKVDLNAYQTKQNRRKLVGAYSDKSPIVAIFHIEEECEFMLKSSNGRRLLVHSGAISPKTTKNTQGVGGMTQKKGHRLTEVSKYVAGSLEKEHRYRTKTLPAAGSTPLPGDFGEQLTL